MKILKPVYGGLPNARASCACRSKDGRISQYEIKSKNTLTNIKTTLVSGLGMQIVPPICLPEVSE